MATFNSLPVLFECGECELFFAAEVTVDIPAPLQ